MTYRALRATALAIACAGLSGLAQAAVISTTLGNATPGFAPGAVPTIFEIGAAQAGQPAPFDLGNGLDTLFGPSLSANWTFNFGAIANPILSATLTLGIVDHDSAASGSQVGLYTLDGGALTGALDTAFEANGGAADQEYGVYTLTLGASFFASLNDGAATVALDLLGPGLVPTLFPLPGPNPPTETANNGAFLIFSTLEITTQDAPPPPVPAPATWLLLAAGLAALRLRRS